MNVVYQLDEQEDQASRKNKDIYESYVSENKQEISDVMRKYCIPDQKVVDKSDEAQMNPQNQGT